MNLPRIQELVRVFSTTRARAWSELRNHQPNGLDSIRTAKVSQFRPPQPQPKTMQVDGRFRMEQPHKDRQYVYVTVYKHYRTGKLMVASEYGYTCWRFLSKKKK